MSTGTAIRSLRSRTRAAARIAVASLGCAVGVAGAAPAALDGIWQSHGYGVVAVIEKGKVTLYDVTRATCVRNTAWPWTEYRLAELAHLSADGQSLSATGPWGLTEIRFDRLAQVPATCKTANVDVRDPAYNFEVFWHTFDEHYAFSAERGVDWKAIWRQYRATLSPATSDAQLQEIIASIFRQLQDRHVMLIAGSTRLRSGLPAIITRWYLENERQPGGPTDALLTDKLAEYLGPSWATYLDAGTVRHVSANVTVGTALDGRIGYVSIASESGYADRGSAATDRDAALAELGAVFSGFRGREGLIVDLRMNYGGNDEVGLGIAGLLADRDRPGFTKCARDGGTSTPAQHTTIHRLTHAFSGPTVVLTSSLTASAAENIAMMVKDFPNVILVGDRTAGVHSDPLSKSLPNGWRFMLSNERFVAPDGRSYEAGGVPPDILVAYDPDEVLKTGIDPLFEKALHLLGSGTFSTLVAKAKRPPASGRRSLCP